MARRWLALLGGIVGALGVVAAQPQPRMSVPGGATLPTTCNVREIYFRTATTVGLYECTAANTWTTVGSNITIAWANITGTPTTLAGYGITDAVPTTRTINGHALSANVTLAYSDFGTMAWGNLTGTPTTLAGYGITDGAPNTPTFITQTASASLTNEQALGALASGLVLNTTTTGVLSIYGGTSCGAGQFVNALSVSGASTCATPAGGGDVNGPGVAVTANDVVFWNGTSGTSIKDSGLTLSGSNTGDQALWSSLVVSGQTTLTPSSTATSLTIIAGTNITLTTDNTAKSLTITASGTGAPTNATYLTQTTESGLSAEFSLGTLTTGLLLNTVTAGTGVPSAYGGTSCTNQVITALSASGAASCTTLTSAYVDSSIATAANTLSFTNKTYDAEATGNVLTLPFYYSYVAAVCQNTTATLGANTPTANPAVAACVTGTNTQFGTADFAAASDLSMQGHFMLPADFTGTIDWKGKWFSATTSGNVVWQVATTCVAAGETSDPAFNTASTVTSAAQGTTLWQQDAAITGVTITGCAAGEELYWKIERNAGAGSDTMNGTAKLVSFVFLVRRAI